MNPIKLIARYKIYLDRARAYIGLIQFVMLGVIMAKQFGIKLGVVGSVILIMVFLLISLIIGFLDTKLGIRCEEQKNYTESNKILMDIYKEVKKK